jgi:hypothetical protein
MLRLSSACLKQHSLIASLILSAAIFCIAKGAQAGVFAVGSTISPNNDDSANSPNYRGFFNGAGWDGDQLFIVQPSNGITEYSFNLSANFSNDPAERIWVELGFGVGDSFVSAANVLPNLDFDTPLPAMPAPESSVFSSVNHQPHTIEFFNGHIETTEFSVAMFSIDVPDLPTSVNSFYEADQLPANLPAGAAVFTLRTRSEGELIGPVLSPSFKSDYSVVDLGTITGVSTQTGGYGGLTFMPGDPQTLLIGGNANASQGALFQVKVVRDADNHITGFIEPATRYADAPNIDGGLQYGPGGVLFLTRWPPEQNAPIAQHAPGSTTPNKIVSLEPLGVTDAPGGLSFVPAGLPGQGQLKVVGVGGSWYTLEISPDGHGTFDITAAHPGPVLAENANGIAYVLPGSPAFGTTPTVLIPEFTDDGRINAYDLDANGNPIPETKRSFLTGLTDYAVGALIDPLTGDLLFTMTPFFGDGKVFVVRGFVAPVPESSTGALGLSGLVVCLLHCAFRNRRMRVTCCIRQR